MSGASLLNTPNYGGHGRSRSIEEIGTFDPGMVSEAARLGLQRSPVFARSTSPYLGYSNSGLSPRSPYLENSFGGGRRGSIGRGGGMSPSMQAYTQNYYGLGDGGDGYDIGGSPGMDDYGLGDGTDVGEHGMRGGGGDMYGQQVRMRRDSMPFEEKPLFDTRGY